MSPVALVILGLGLAGILMWLLPDRGAMQEHIAEQRAGKLSLIYLELGVHERPEDERMRLLLARRYYELSRYGDAERTLVRLLDQDSDIGREARLLLAEIRHAHCAVLKRTGSDQAEGCARDLLAAMRGWIDGRLAFTPAAMDRLAELGAAHGDGALATKVYVILAEKAPEVSEKIAWYRKALAITTSAELAAELIREMLRLQPDDPALIDEAITAELAINEIDSALELSQRLVDLDPADRRAHERLATVADWAGRSLLALDQWTWLARHGGAPRHLDRAMALARGNWDQHLLLELSWLAARQRGMGREDVLELARLYVRLGDPETARALLAQQIAAHPDHRPSWEALRDVQLATADLDAAAGAWAHIQARFGISEGERREYAALLWRARRPDEALAILEDDARLEPATLRLIAELAWRLEQVDRARAAYETLWRHGEARPDEIQRLLLLARHQGDVDLGIEVALDRWQRRADPQALLTAMRMAADAGRWRDLDRMLDQAARAPAGAPMAAPVAKIEAEPEYWRLRMLRGHRRLRHALRHEDLARAGQILVGLDRDLARAADRSPRFARHPDYPLLRADVHRQQLHIALQRGDRATARRVLAEAGDDIPDADRVATLAYLGEHTQATRLAVRARRDARDPDQRARLTSQAESLAERVPRHAWGHTRLLALGGLRLIEAGGGFRFAWNRAQVGARLAGQRLQPRAGAPSGVQAATEAELMALAAWHTEATHTELGAGAHVHGAGVTPQLGLGHERGLGPGARAAVDLGIGRLTEETAQLRGTAVRDHLSVRATMDMSARLFASTRLAGMLYRARAQGRLGTGLDLEAAMGYRLQRGPRDWNLRLIGLLSPRWLDATGPAPSTKLSLATTLAQGWPGAAPSPVGRLRYFAELAGGWLVATDTVDFALGMGLGMPVFGGDELSLAAALAGSTGVLAEDPSRSITLRYTRSLWQ